MIKKIILLIVIALTLLAVLKPEMALAKPSLSKAKSFSKPYKAPSSTLNKSIITPLMVGVVGGSMLGSNNAHASNITTVPQLEGYATDCKPCGLNKDMTCGTFSQVAPSEYIKKFSPKAELIGIQGNKVCYKVKL